MRLAFFGSSLVSSYWNGAATYYRGLLKALAARGFEITFYEPDAYERQEHRDIADPDWARVVVYAPSESGAARAMEHAAHADVIVKASGVGVCDEWLDEAVALRRRPRQVGIFWDVDAPATLDRLARHADDPFTPLVPAFDMILTYGGGPPVVAAYGALGARLTTPIYNAVDPTTHYPVESDARFAADLTFLGNRLPDREARVEEFFLKPAASLPSRRFLLGGSGWDAGCLPANVRCLGHVGTGDHNALNSSALVILNISRSSMASTGYSPATRVFEAAGAGACVITDDWVGIEEFLEPGTEVLTAHDGGEVRAWMDRLSRTDGLAIGQAARRRVLAHHTYDRRAAQVDALLCGRDGD